MDLSYREFNSHFGMKIKLGFGMGLSALLILGLGTTVFAQGEPPAPYAGMKNPFPWGDKKAVEMGELLFDRACAVCHNELSLVYQGHYNIQVGIRTQALEEHPDFYFWTISEGRAYCHTMPTHKTLLPEKQRWQILNYFWSGAKEYEEVHKY